ncbi:heme peroxidase family protein [Amycolatopsis acidiphila]|uniref:Heme peroxidase n=1 Tax=Amycolatopsis acidiphila TaxID=715473 RepID=A0A557ZYX7_9PSEU|nr:heme peroxidase family protein [Amycolatopsis acidiphila]TVT17216.1 heme peroxidase [Amycolatopsis acidiphila]UIJ58077.1 heme peroxidase family protein [Amycolatopsis acidiphila]GHG70223.1 myeloperoxidase [Amycolatopsis acidiphila]
MRRHNRERYYVINEGDLTFDEQHRPIGVWPSPTAEPRRFRFSRLGKKGPQADNALLQELAKAMTAVSLHEQDSDIPAGFTYLGQFVDHDLTLDRTATALGDDVTVDELVQGRSPALDLDSLYGRGPVQDKHFYSADGIKLRVGTTAAIDFDAGTNINRTGFDLPRVGTGSTKAAERTAQIPDTRNDENLAVAQTHVAFINFHNRVVDRLVARPVPSALLFEQAREEVVKHYQWLLREDYLPRIVHPTIVDDVFAHGRKVFDPGAGGGPATMPIEFSVAAFRLGHSMVRETYSWNRIFEPGGLTPATLLLLFAFSGTSGIRAPPGDLDDPNAGGLRLPTNWIVDWRRLHDFGPSGRPELEGPGINRARRMDTILADPLATLPAGAFGGRDAGLQPDDIQRNLAFRNLVRANMVELATGQQMAEQIGTPALSAEQVLVGSGDGADLTAIPAQLRDQLVANTPLWFYVLREAEINGGRLNGVGGRIVAEVFHRCMESSRYSILREPEWRPWLGKPEGTSFTMMDLLLVAFDGKAENLNPLGDKP